MQNFATSSDYESASKNWTSTNDNNVLISDKPNSARKCSYCRKFCDTSVTFCTKCRKRAYCSETCRAADWSIEGNGQRHVNWCVNYECGEEDVDWEVVPIPLKGLGIIAKRFIPAGYRIMADNIYTDPRDHPGFIELAPDGATLETKFHINCIEEDEESEEKYVGLRFSRANHSCEPNADYVYDETTGVIILFSQKDIQPGEEICICYWPFADLGLNRKTANLSPEEEFLSVQNYLADRYGIICPEDCFCRDSNARQLVLEGRRFHAEMSALVGRGKIEKALEFGEKLLSIRRRLNVSMVEQFETEYHCYQIALLGGEAIDSRAKEYLQNVYEFHKRICRYSEFTKTCESLLFQHQNKE